MGERPSEALPSLIGSLAPLSIADPAPENPHRDDPRHMGLVRFSMYAVTASMSRYFSPYRPQFGITFL